ncbi:MAG TPA: ATP-binding protein [Candidatus Saccharimonadales bacterium]|jgi:predicted kinase
MSKIVTQKPFLLMLYGLPGSGKTYFARQFSEEVQAANLQADRIRSELFDKPRYDQQENNVIAQLMDYMAEEFLAAGVSVIYDTNAMRGVQRKALREIAKRHGAIPVLAWLQVDTESAFARNVKRDRRRADDRFAASWDRTTFDSLGSYMQNPDYHEEAIVVSGKHHFSTQRNAVMSKLRDRGILKIEDYSSNLAKPGMINLVPSSNVGRVDMTRRNISIR